MAVRVAVSTDKALFACLSCSQDRGGRPPETGVVVETMESGEGAHDQPRQSRMTINEPPTNRFQSCPSHQSELVRLLSTSRPGRILCFFPKYTSREELINIGSRLTLRKHYLTGHATGDLYLARSMRTVSVSVPSPNRVLMFGV